MSRAHRSEETGQLAPGLAEPAADRANGYSAVDAIRLDAAVTAADNRAVAYLTCAAMVRAHSIDSACAVSTSRS